MKMTRSSHSEGVVTPWLRLSSVCRKTSDTQWSAVQLLSELENMQTPMQIEFHDVEYSQSFEILVRKRLRKLETVFPRLRRCQVFLWQSPAQGGRNGFFDVRIALHVPGGELVIKREQRENVHAALNEAFEAACQELEQRARRIRSGQTV